MATTVTIADSTAAVQVNETIVTVEVGGVATVTYNGQQSYTHTQAVPLATWTVAHNLGFYPSVTVTLSDGREIEGAVTHTDANNVSIAFANAVTGSAYFS